MTSADESRDRSVAASTADGGSCETEHRHRWAGVAFFLEDDHPWFRMRCACGAERTIRAWERYSDPEREPDAPAAAVED